MESTRLLYLNIYLRYSIVKTSLKAIQRAFKVAYAAHQDRQIRLGMTTRTIRPSKKVR